VITLTSPEEESVPHDLVLTVKDVARRFQVPISWVYERTRRRGSDRIPHRKMGKYLRFLAVEVDEWFKNLPGNLA